MIAVSSSAQAVRRLPPLAVDRSVQAGAAACFVALALAAGVAVARQPWVAAAAPLALVVATVLANWRFGVKALLVFLPFAGLPTFVLAKTFAPVVKDVVLVLPLYLSFAVAAARTGRRVIPKGDPVVALGAVFAGLVLAYVIVSPSLLVGAIGLKVWLAYVPLYLVGYHYAARIEDVVGLLRLTVVIAFIPVVLALAEFVFFAHHGDFGPVMPLYGTFSNQIVQQVGFGQAIPRIPSTFTSSASYYNFSLIALAAAIGLWRYRPRFGSGLTVMLFALGALASGDRRSYFTVPLLVIVALGVGGSAVSTKVRLAFGAAALILLLSAVNVSVPGLVDRLEPLTRSELSVSVHREFLPALADGAIGHGTGADTNAALRYGGLVSPQGWQESWYTKALIEFGVAGLVAALLLIAAAVRRAYRALRSVQPSVRRLGAPLWAALFVTALTLVRASELDWDPMDAYFWLLAGLLVALPRLAATNRSARATTGES